MAGDHDGPLDPPDVAQPPEGPEHRALVPARRGEDQVVEVLAEVDRILCAAAFTGVKASVRLGVILGSIELAIVVGAGTAPRSRTIERSMPTTTSASMSSLQRIDAELLAGYEAGPGSVSTRRGALWYSLAVLPFVDALLHGSDEPMVVGVRNDGRIAGVPDSTIVEVPHVVPRPGQLVALEPPPLPALPALLLAQVGAYEALTVDACVPGAPPEARLRALLANPLVRDADRAAALLAVIDAGSPLA